MYGKELIMDISHCDVSMLEYLSVLDFCDELCQLLKAEPVGGFHFLTSRPNDETEGNLKTYGFSATQFLIASSVTVHGLPLLKRVFVNVFTCGEMSETKVQTFTAKWFCGRLESAQCVVRGARLSDTPQDAQKLT